MQVAIFPAMMAFCASLQNGKLFCITKSFCIVHTFIFCGSLKNALWTWDWHEKTRDFLARECLCIKKIVDDIFPPFKKPQPSKCYFDGGGECYRTTYSFLKCEKKRKAAYLHCNFFTFFFSNGAAAPNHEVQNTFIQM